MWAAGKNWPLTVQQRVEDELPVLLDQIVDVAEDATGQAVSTADVLAEASIRSPIGP